MKRLLSLGGAAFTYFCVATVISLVAATAGLWLKGALDSARLYRVMAALHGIDVVTMQQQLVATKTNVDAELPSYRERFEKLALKSLDLDMRENAIDNAWVEMNEIRVDLEVKTTRFEELKEAYASKLQQLADEEQATSLRELQRTLEAIKPDQAKQQILKMLEDDAMDDVVTIIKNMPIDKRKKIIGEFEAGPDVEALYDILKNIRLGEPIASQIQETQDKLDRFGGAR